jgi:hypothetical protein
MRLRVVIAIVLSLASASPALAGDAPYVGWTSLLPGAGGHYDPSSADECRAGKKPCVDKVIREMTKRFDPLAASCDHNAIFALTYLRVTEEYRRTIEDPTFFSEPSFVNHEDAVFASLYFHAYDAWAGGRRSDVPAAWRIAFDAARNREVSAAGNLLLGINAHVQRDLPFTLEAIGLVRPDRTSRKPDHDKVNEILNRVADDAVAETARRFDPTIDDGNLPGTVDDFALFQLIPTWREIAWRNAERLKAAPTPEARALVAQEIEEYAASQAHELKMLTHYGPLGSSAARDSYCAAHWAG